MQLAEVVLKNVVKHFKSVHAIENLSIEIKDREFAVFVGPSGCGKAKALRMIADWNKSAPAIFLKVRNFEKTMFNFCYIRRQGRIYFNRKTP
jgi:ABC-type Fe3+/spermidine/putrescine transport system ATPase subunit